MVKDPGHCGLVARDAGRIDDEPAALGRRAPLVCGAIDGFACVEIAPAASAALMRSIMGLESTIVTRSVFDIGDHPLFVATVAARAHHNGLRTR